MNRTDLQGLAERRLRESQLLYDHEEYAGAYYLAGYAVECALKAAVAKRTRKHDFPDKKLVIDSYTHDLHKLARAAGLRGAIDAEIRRALEFELNWTLVLQWSEASRYQSRAEPEAKGLIEAISDPKHGVLQWLRPHW